MGGVPPLKCKHTVYYAVYSIVYVIYTYILSIRISVMDKIEFYTNIAKSGDRIYVNILHQYHKDVKDLIGRQVKVTIE